MRNQTTVAVCGVRGYVGRELLALIENHPYLCLSENITGPDVKVLILATPPEVSMDLIRQYHHDELKIIDMSGAMRLPADEFQQWYGIPHQCDEILASTQYGLSPWNLKHDHAVVANPGCYATAALMTLIPLIQANVINTCNIIIDAKSGVSGAGKKLQENLMFCEMSENFFPYKIGKHQHIPEIKMGLKQVTNQSCQLTFVSHMLPLSRGISMSIYADANEKFTADPVISAAIAAAYHAAYQNYPLVKWGAINTDHPEQDRQLLSLKTVVNTPETHIGFYVENHKVYLFASIDNLLKGAASQAIENINALCNLPVQTGLKISEVNP